MKTNVIQIYKNIKTRRNDNTYYKYVLKFGNDKTIYIIIA